MSSLTDKKINIVQTDKELLFCIRINSWLIVCAKMLIMALIMGLHFLWNIYTSFPPPSLFVCLYIAIAPLIIMRLMKTFKASTSSEFSIKHHTYVTAGALTISMLVTSVAVVWLVRFFSSGLQGVSPYNAFKVAGILALLCWAGCVYCSMISPRFSHSVSFVFAGLVSAIVRYIMNMFYLSGVDVTEAHNIMHIEAALFFFWGLLCAAIAFVRFKSGTLMSGGDYGESK